MLERKKLKSRDHGVPESLSPGVFWCDIEELTFLITMKGEERIEYNLSKLSTWNDYDITFYITLDA